jgi:glycine betaine/proline transport system ATP-binding protein
MEPLESFEKRMGTLDQSNCPVASPNDSLDALVNASIDSDEPIVVHADGKAVGVVTKRALLRGIQGRMHDDDISVSQAGETSHG